MSESSNVSSPYLNDNGSPRLETSLVVFLDILGYRDLITEGPEQETLTRLRSVVDRTYQHLRGSGGPLGSDERFYEIKTFSDNIIIGCPCSDDFEFELGYILSGASYFQLQMALANFFVRGAITFGNLYIDENIIFGSALIEAYREENEVAANPRIILSQSMESYIREHIGYYQSHLYRRIYCDTDRRYFLNYLEILLIDPARIDRALLMQHRNIIERNLDRYQAEPKIRSKYVWVARYHNYFCIQNSSLFDESYRIDMTPINFTRISAEI